MDDQQKQLGELINKAEQLEKTQESLTREILRLRKDIHEIATGLKTEIRPAEKKEVPATKPTVVNEASPVKTTILPSDPPLPKKESPPLEEFIGSNLLNKIGIAVLVIGIGFGVKYAIDHQMLNPLTRIVLGYLAGTALLVIAIRLKKNYENFSAVLLSGGISALYFITYAAYDFYGLIPQLAAFIIMVLFTVFTVVSALQYNMQIIAIIGLVGAYAVPFLLSDGSGKVLVLYSYMAIINSGILILSFKKYWKKLYYLAFGITWLIFLSWFLFGYEESRHFWLSLIFSSVFFLIFYTTFLAYQLIRKEPLGRADIVLMLLNSFIQFGIGYSAIDGKENGEQFLGLFTLSIAIIHFIACLIIFKRQREYKDIFYFVAGMVLTFLTIAVPVQLEGNWVTLVWGAEAALLFWIGRAKQFPAYEKMAYPLIVLSIASLIQDWDRYYAFRIYSHEDFIQFTPFINIHFFTALWVVAALFVVFRLYHDKRLPSPSIHKEIKTLIHYGLPASFLIVLYLSFYKEIEYFWNARFVDSTLVVQRENDSYTEQNFDLLRFKSLWLINYSALFGAALTVYCLRWVRQKETAITTMVYNYIVLGAFLLIGLYELSWLRKSYLNQIADGYYIRDYYHVLIRHIVLVFTLPLLWCNYRIAKFEFIGEDLRKTERVLFHMIALAIVSSELVHVLDLARVPNTFKLALSILWGVYALCLIVYGLHANLKYIRVMAIILFGVTLFKLFFYDMAEMSTLSKTLVMVVLGALLLTASFLYNRNKKINNGERSEG